MKRTALATGGCFAIGGLRRLLYFPLARSRTFITRGKGAVNYSPLKREACPWRYAAEGASETCGWLTAARREMFTAAMWSANPECPQDTQEKVL